jgi:hypothetical protein
MGVGTAYGISYTTIRVLYSVQKKFGTAEEVAYIITFSTKLVLDLYVMSLFVITFRYFLQKRFKALAKEALRLTPFNKFILVSIIFLFFMRIAGAVYTFLVGILVLTPLFNTPAQTLSYVILDDLVFPIRDFFEVLLFSYLFFYQSKKKINLDQINERWKMRNGTMESGITSSTGGVAGQHPPEQFDQNE